MDEEFGFASPGQRVRRKSVWSVDGDGEPVLHVVLVPAEGCTRTEVSFYQSIPYLERVGGLLTKDYQFCHIGE